MTKAELKKKLINLLEKPEGSLLGFDSSKFEWIQMSDKERIELIDAIKSSKLTKARLKKAYNLAPCGN